MTALAAFKWDATVVLPLLAVAFMVVVAAVVAWPLKGGDE